MTARGSTPTRVSADIAAAAASVAPSEHRSVAEQINHWARLGMQVERSASVGGRQVLAVVTGDAQFSSLTPEERKGAELFLRQVVDDDDRDMVARLIGQ